MPANLTNKHSLGPAVFWALWASGLGLIVAMALGYVPGGLPGIGAVFLGLCITIAIGVMSQRCGFFASPLNRVPGARGRLSLTFDDGPDPKFTPLLLDMLAAAGQRATFFVVGQRLARHPDLARRIVQEGHELACHSMEHRWHMALWPPGRVADDLEHCAALMREHADVAPTLFRPPVAVLSPRIAAGAQLAGLTLVGYSVRSGDGSPAVPARIVLRRLQAGLEDGAVLLMHDGAVAGRAPASVEVLPRLLKDMTAAGLESVPLGELAASAR